MRNFFPMCTWKSSKYNNCDVLHLPRVLLFFHFLLYDWRKLNGAVFSMRCYGRTSSEDAMKTSHLEERQVGTVCKRNFAHRACLRPDSVLLIGWKLYESFTTCGWLCVDWLSDAVSFFASKRKLIVKQTLIKKKKVSYAWIPECCQLMSCHLQYILKTMTL